MVTILEPREMVSLEPHRVEDTPTSRPARIYRMGYTVPCAGVRYYSFEEVETTPQAPVVLHAKLIDERVILI